jgi:hypothetical protein
MKLYKVKLSMSLIHQRLNGFRLGKYNYVDPIIFVEADDPDEACHDSVYGLYELMIKQDDSLETKLLFRDIVYDIRVTKVYIP